MNFEQKCDLRLEILVATVNRTSLDFIDEMFKNVNIDRINILIVNQTSESNLLNSNEKKIRVINSFDRGLSKSRNLAILNAQGDICLIADDDVVFIKDFDLKILEAYNKNNSNDVLTFKTETFTGKPFSDYTKNQKSFKNTIRKVLSIETSFRRERIVQGNYKYDECFGLGATFEDSENFLFLKNIIDDDILKCQFIPEFIVKHKAHTSSDEVNSDRFIFARSALNFKLHGNFSYLYVFKLLFSLVRTGKIPIGLVLKKYIVALNGIKTYKTLIHEY